MGQVGMSGLYPDLTRRARDARRALRRPCGRIALLPPALLATRVDEHVLLRCSAAPSTAATWIAELLVAPSRPPGYLMGCTLRQTTSSGAALKIELYVPEMIPIRSASPRPWIVSPP